MSCVLLFASCNNVLKKQNLPEVDFNIPREVQLTYRQNIYNLRISYSSGEVTIVFIDDTSALNGVSYTINSENCRVTYTELTYDIPVEKLSSDFFPLVIFNFVSEFLGVVPTEYYNTQILCSYITRSVSDNTVTLEVYKNENNIAHSLIIT